MSIQSSVTLSDMYCIDNYLLLALQYIIDAHEKLKVFFRECCNRSVREPEEEFCMDHYYEATLIAKPVIYISLAEICDTHQLLLDYRLEVASVNCTVRSFPLLAMFCFVCFLSPEVIPLVRCDLTAFGP